MAIYTKLLEFQKLGITLKKDGTNPHFSSSYVTLNEVLDKVKKPLNDMGIVIIQRGECEWSDGEQVSGLVTELVDTEDETRVRAFMPYVGATDSQKLGSANTYLRRYSLITLLGLEDEDLDGEDAINNITGVGDAKGEPFSI